MQDFFFLKMNQLNDQPTDLHFNQRMGNFRTLG